MLALNNSPGALSISIDCVWSCLFSSVYSMEIDGVGCEKKEIESMLVVTTCLGFAIKIS